MPEPIVTDPIPSNSTTTSEVETLTDAPALKKPKLSATTSTVPRLFVKKLSERATIPTKGSKHAAGFDLYAAIDPAENDGKSVITIPPHGKALIKTDISIAFNNNETEEEKEFGTYSLYARIAPRSGLAWKQHVGIGAGVVDADYRGPVGVVMFNHSSKENVEVKQGDRIAQMILEKYESRVEVCEEVEELDETVRGGGGFGSTGKWVEGGGFGSTGK